MFAVEESSFCIRLLCKNLRPWTMTTSEGRGGPGEHNVRCMPVLSMEGIQNLGAGAILA